MHGGFGVSISSASKGSSRSCTLTSSTISQPSHLPATPRTLTPQLAGNLADLGNVYMNRFMIAYIILRGVYVRQYVINETQKGSMVRSAFWGLSACE